MQRYTQYTLAYAFRITTRSERGISCVHYSTCTMAKHYTLILYMRRYVYTNIYRKTCDLLRIKRNSNLHSLGLKLQSIIIMAQAFFWWNKRCICFHASYSTARQVRTHRQSYSNVRITNVMRHHECTRTNLKRPENTAPVLIPFSSFSVRTDLADIDISATWHPA